MTQTTNYPAPGAGLSETCRELTPGQHVYGPLGYLHTVLSVHENGFYAKRTDNGKKVEVSRFAAERWSK